MPQYLEKLYKSMSLGMQAVIAQQGGGILNIEGLMSHEKHFFQTINHLCPILSRFLIPRL